MVRISCLMPHVETVFMWISTACSKRSVVLLLDKRRLGLAPQRKHLFDWTRTHHATHVVNALGKFSWTLDSHVIRSCVLRSSQVGFRAASTGTLSTTIHKLAI